MCHWNSQALSAFGKGPGAMKYYSRYIAARGFERDVMYDELTYTLIVNVVEHHSYVADPQVIVSEFKHLIT